MNFSDAKSHLEGEKAETMELLEKLLIAVFSNKTKNPFMECETILRGLRNPKKPHDDITDELMEERHNHCQQQLGLLQQPMEEDGATAKALCAVPNFLEQAELFESAGYGFGQLNYKVVCALRVLAATGEGLKKVRLWGKINGSRGDYWVAEGILDGAGEPSEDPLFEPQGSGTNVHSYWVASNLDGVWERLPDVEPNHIIVSRQIEYMFSGNLNASISSYPFFPGTERHFLRAVIARITADTILHPIGFMEENEDGTEVVEAAEFTFPAQDEFKNISQWIHSNKYILKNGRTAYPEVDPEAEDAEVQQKAYDEAVAADPPQKHLRGLTAKQWAMKQCKATDIRQAHSLKWPGAVCCIKGTSFANLYVGYGRQMTQREYVPNPPFAVLDEEPDQEEQPEPQPVGGLPVEEEPPAEEAEG